MPGDDTATRLRVVLDTNIYVSAYLSGGIPGRVYELGLSRRYRIVTSPHILLETRNVLRDKFGWQERVVTVRIRQIVRKADIVRAQQRITLLPQGGDNRVLECAVEGRADLIVTGDRDLLRLRHYAGIYIVRAIDLLRTLGEPVP